MPESLRRIEIRFLQEVLWIHAAAKFLIEPKSNHPRQSVVMAPEQFAEGRNVSADQSFLQVGIRMREIVHSVP
jgi:hypothetical protein